jgi:glucose-1-phosphate adenylyltransferase
MQDVLVFILGGGRGTRLFPLTKHRSEPAVPIAGKYRLIDIPISNCINNDFHKIYVLTQYMSVSLHRHIANAYKFTQFSRGFVEVLAAQQTNDRAEWFRGTADAIRQNMRYLEVDSCRDVVILCGDQLYRMDFQKVLRAHQDCDADVTLAVLPVTAEQASNYGVVRVDAAGRIAQMVEKPKAPAQLPQLRSAREWWQQQKPTATRGEYLANMGIYFFKRQALLDLLARHAAAHDMVTEILMHSLASHHLHAYLFDGYWEDLGSVKTYFEANLALTTEHPPFDFYAEEGVIYTRMRDLPASRVLNADVAQSLVSDGCLVEPGARIERSVIGVRSHIGKNARLREVVMMGANFYDIQSQGDGQSNPNQPCLGIGEGSVVEKCIVDKNCRIGRNVKILNRQKQQHADGPNYYIRDGIVILPNSAVVPDGTVI